MDDESQTCEVLANNLASLSKIVASLNAASGSLIGRGAQALMYQTGKDLGKMEGDRLDRTDNLATAVQMIVEHEKNVYGIELWKDVGDADYVVREGSTATARLLFRECPIRQVCVAHGVPMDDVICRISSGMIAGMLGKIMQRKVDIRVEHAGPNTCMKVATLKD